MEVTTQTTFHNREIMLPNYQPTYFRRVQRQFRNRRHCRFGNRHQIVLAMFIFSVLATDYVSAQQSDLFPQSTMVFPVFPRGEYYMGLQLLRDGNTNAAIQGFGTAIRLGSQINNNRGIDSVPSMVMLGECFYQQGNLGAALDQFDAALELSISQSVWLSAVQPKPPAGEFSPPQPKGITWYNSVRGSRLPAYSNRWPIVLVTPGLYLTTPSGITMLSGDIYTIDALEILRCQAFALRRRWMILGPLASKFPLTQSIGALFGPPAPNLSPPIEASLAICQAYALLASGESGQAEKIFKAYVTMSGGMDHGTTALGLMGLADLAASKNDFAAATRLLLESTVIAARLVQYEHITEAISELSGIAAAQRDSTAIPIFRQIGNWANGRSSLLIAQSMASMIENQIAVGDIVSANLVFSEAAAIRSARDVYVPRIESKFLFSTAEIAAIEGDIVDAKRFTEQAMALITNPIPASSGIPRIYRLRLWENLARNGQIDRQTAFSVAAIILADPSEADWNLDPLGCLSWLSIDKLTAYDLAIQLSLRKKDTAALLNLVDQSQRHLIHKVTPLGGRLQSIRMLFHADGNMLPANAAKDAVRLKAAYPEIQTLAQSMEQLLKSIHAQPMELNKTHWSKDYAHLWNQASILSAKQEAAMWRVALSRDAITQVFPPAVDLAALKKELPEGDVAICIFPAEDHIQGLLISRTEEKYWQSIKSEQFASMLQLLLKQIGVFDKDPQSNPAWAKKEWEKTSADFYNLLFPKDIQKSLSKSKRVFIVPTANVWYLPFEMLPLDPTKSPAPWISGRRVVYLPTLGFIPRCLAETQIQKTRLLVVSDKNFFAIDDRQNRQFVEELLTSAPMAYDITLGKTDEQFQESQGARFQASRVIVATKQTLEYPAVFSPFAYDWKMPSGTLSSWMTLPLGGPRDVILPGLTLTGHETLSSEIFQLACSMMANGTKSIMISRWPVGGASTHHFVSDYQRELDFIPASEAFQRSMFDLWATDLDAATEPILDFKPGAPNIVKGAYPIFWSTYMQIGDTNPKNP